VSHFVLKHLHYFERHSKQLIILADEWVVTARLYCYCLDIDLESKDMEKQVYMDEEEDRD